MIIYDKNKTAINLKQQCIASGGEGEIHLHPSNKKQVIKVYHQARSVDFELLLNKLAKLDARFIKPIDIFYDKKGLIAGFSMNFVNFNDYFLLNNLFNKGFCNKNSLDQTFKIDVLEKLKSAVEYCHKNNIIIGDLNQYNIFFSLKGEIIFVDVDSYSEKGHIRSDVLLEDIRDFSTNTIDEKSDSYAFDTLTFWILTFCHPFKWVAPGITDTFEQKVKSGKSYLSKIPNLKIPPIYNPLPSILEQQFIDIFKGRRFMVDFNNTPAQINIQVQASITSVNVDIREIDSGILDMRICNDTVAVRFGANSWKLYSAKNFKGLSLKELVNQKEVYPADDSFCYIDNSDTLFTRDGKPVRDISGCYNNYQSGELFVLDYHNDSCYMYKIKNQLANTIDFNKQIIFAQSVTIRNSIIQNFGAKKVTGLLRNKNLVLIDIPQSTKDLIISGDYICIESVEKGKIVNTICKINNTRLEKVMYVNNLVDFTSKGDFLFIPASGEIEVYKDGHLLEKLDVPMCTENSKMSMTSAGLVMLENKKLFLINKK